MPPRAASSRSSGSNASRMWSASLAKSRTTVSSFRGLVRFRRESICTPYHAAQLLVHIHGMVWRRGRSKPVWNLLATTRNRCSGFANSAAVCWSPLRRAALVFGSRRAGMRRNPSSVLALSGRGIIGCASESVRSRHRRLGPPLRGPVWNGPTTSGAQRAAAPVLLIFRHAGRAHRQTVPAKRRRQPG